MLSAGVALACLASSAVVSAGQVAGVAMVPGESAGAGALARGLLEAIRGRRFSDEREAVGALGELGPAGVDAVIRLMGEPGLAVDERIAVFGVARSLFMDPMMDAARPALGVTFDAVELSRGAPAGGPRWGVRVVATSPGFPSRAILEPGDVIVAIDGRAIGDLPDGIELPGDGWVSAGGAGVRETAHFQYAILSSDPGRSLELSIARGMQMLRLAVPLGRFAELGRPVPDSAVLPGAFLFRMWRVLGERPALDIPVLPGPTITPPVGGSERRVAVSSRATDGFGMRVWLDYGESVLAPGGTAPHVATPDLRLHFDAGTAPRAERVAALRRVDEGERDRQAASLRMRLRRLQTELSTSHRMLVGDAWRRRAGDAPAIDAPGWWGDAAAFNRAGEGLPMPPGWELERLGELRDVVRALHELAAAATAGGPVTAPGQQPAPNDVK